MRCLFNFRSHYLSVSVSLHNYFLKMQVPKRINATSKRISPYCVLKEESLFGNWQMQCKTIRSIDSCPIKLKVQYNAMEKFWEIYTHHSGLPISNTSKTLCSHTIKVTFEYEYWLFWKELKIQVNYTTHLDSKIDWFINISFCKNDRFYYQ